MKDFCSNIQCEEIPIEECQSDLSTGINREIVENVTGRGCCPACVEYIDEDMDCKVGSRLKKCRYGLFCNPSTQKCNLPPVKNKCVIEYHNRHLIHESNTQMYFYLRSNRGDLDFPIKYAKDMELPTCDHETGRYELKQCMNGKCYCVDPIEGKHIFGLTESYLADNLTCKCAGHFYEKLVTGVGKSKGDYDAIDKENMEYYAAVHSKCDSTGNFEPLQCINSTCFCVDDKTGKPLREKTVIYGALSTLSCFDEEKAKKLKTKEANPNYQNPCEKQLLTSKSLMLHFAKKGTKLRGLDEITCQFDGQFAPRQCKPNMCHCTNPKGGLIPPYSADRASGKDANMMCMCALQEYFSGVEKKAFNQLQCDGLGNFNAYQCFDNNNKCFCVDEFGSRISKVEPSTCLENFIRESETPFVKDEICRGMRKTLTDRPMSKNKYYVFDSAVTSFYEVDEKPKNIFHDNNQCKLTTVLGN